LSVIRHLSTNRDFLHPGFHFSILALNLTIPALDSIPAAIPILGSPFLLKICRVALFHALMLDNTVAK
jgi:hypothetical protein